MKFMGCCYHINRVEPKITDKAIPYIWFKASVTMMVMIYVNKFKNSSMRSQIGNEPCNFKCLTQLCQFSVEKQPELIIIFPK